MSSPELFTASTSVQYHTFLARNSRLWRFGMTADSVTIWLIESWLTFGHHRYEFYYDVILRGQYTFHIRDLHAKYGPIIRINPYELHILYPDYYETLYATSASGEKRDKWVWYAKQFGSFDSTFATIEHDLHKARRAALARYFSMASVRKLQHVLDKKVQRLMERIRNFKGADGDALVIDHAFSAFTTGEPGISSF